MLKSHIFYDQMIIFIFAISALLIIIKNYLDFIRKRVEMWSSRTCDHYKILKIY